jgi:uncharacterized membrane protein
LNAIHEQIAARSLGRLAALSDAVFAIAMTLIVLEIRLPDASVIENDSALLTALADLAPRFVTYLMGFLTLGIFWNGQANQGNYFARADRPLAWITIAFLAIVALLPFTTSLLAEFITFRAAFGLYWANLLLLGLVGIATWTYASRAGLLKQGTDLAVGREIMRRVIAFQVFCAAGLAAGLIWDTRAGIAVILLSQVNSAVAPAADHLRLLRRAASSVEARYAGFCVG